MPTATTEKAKDRYYLSIICALASVVAMAFLFNVDFLGLSEKTKFTLFSLVVIIQVMAIFRNLVEYTKVLNQ